MRLYIVESNLISMDKSQIRTEVVPEVSSKLRKTQYFPTSRPFLRTCIFSLLTVSMSELLPRRASFSSLRIVVVAVVLVVVVVVVVVVVLVVAVVVVVFIVTLYF